MLNALPSAHKQWCLRAGLYGRGLISPAVKESRGECVQPSPQSSLGAQAGGVLWQCPSQVPPCDWGWEARHGGESEA